MKKFIYICCLSLLHACIFTYDPPRGLLHICNNSDEAVYVYLTCGNVDSLPIAPKLELFEFFDNEDGSMIDANDNPLQSRFVSPEYRINAYDISPLHIWGTLDKPCLPCEENEITLFFITEQTMRNYDWNEIYRNQMFAKRIILTEEDLENKDWKYTYPQQ